ncbi:MAG: ATP-binding cassette domain-containing protein, partial [Pedobacter sp.]
MITVSGLTKSFGDNKAVNDISFEVSEGENLVLLGTSGCGKTTTLKMINRLIAPDSGKITINGTDVTEGKPEELRRKIGYVMQSTGLFPHYTIQENIAVVPKLLNWPIDKTQQRTLELLEKFQLPQSILKLYPNELSGGQQQRVGLARALITDPAILLMDEPFGALDNVTRTGIQEEFKALEEFKRKTIVMVTHDVMEAFELADRICVMDKGKIVQIGTPKELLFKPTNDFVSKFLDGQRLALEFKTITIKDLWEFLPDHQNTIELNVTSNKDLSTDLNVWTMMELFNTDKTVDHY